MQKHIGLNQYDLRPATMADLEQIHHLEQTIYHHYYGVEGMTLDRIRKEYLMPGFKISESVRLAFSEQNQLVGLIEIWDLQTPPVHPYIWMRVDPAHEHTGLQRLMLNWAERRAAQVLDRVDSGLRVSLRAHADQTIKSTGKSLRAIGMMKIRQSFRMRIEFGEPPPQPVWPEGITVRGYNPEQDAYTVYQVDEEVFRDHFGYIEQDPEQGYQKFLHHMTGDASYDPSLWFLAEDEEDVVGICLSKTRGYDEPDAGHISSLGVRKPWRRRGIALGLLHHTFGEFYRRGYLKVDLGVDAENLTGALDLYRKAGMFVFRQFDLYEKEIRPGKEVSVTSL